MLNTPPWRLDMKAHLVHVYIASMQVLQWGMRVQASRCPCMYNHAVLVCILTYVCMFTDHVAFAVGPEGASITLSLYVYSRMYACLLTASRLQWGLRVQASRCPSSAWALKCKANVGMMSRSSGLRLLHRKFLSS